MSIIIYTDGSHFKGQELPTFGAYCSYNNHEYELSGICDERTMSKYGITDLSLISNPTAEFVAFCEVLERIKNINAHFIFKIDYIGIQAWISGSWKAKQPHIIKIKKIAQDLIKKYNISFEIKHVKAHSGDIGNDKADTLAKSGIIRDNFNELSV